jgi:hypothetical protein
MTIASILRMGELLVPMNYMIAVAYLVRAGFGSVSPAIPEKELSSPRPLGKGEPLGILQDCYWLIE